MVAMEILFNSVSIALLIALMIYIRRGDKGQ